MSDHTRLEIIQRLRMSFSRRSKSKAQAQAISDLYKKQMIAKAAEKFPGNAVFPMFNQLGSFSSEYERLWTQTTKTFLQTGASDFQAVSGRVVNPLFAEVSGSNGKWITHYATMPLNGFYLVPAMEAARGSGLRKDKDLIGVLMKSAQAQFSVWCTATMENMRADLTTIRAFSGDVLQTAMLLRNHVLGDALAGLPYARHWSFAPLQLNDGEYPKLRFHVIDTSNISDHLGIVNVLAAAKPLLADEPNSTIYTENLQKDSGDDSTFLERSLLTDTDTAIVLLHLAPVEYLLRSTFCNYSPAISATKFMQDPDSRQADRICLSWKRPDAGDTLCSGPEQELKIDEEHLALILLEMLFKMIWYEDHIATLRLGAQGALNKLLQVDYYNRSSWIALIDCCLRRFQLDKEVFAAALLHYVECDRRSMLVSNCAQELYMLLGFYGITTMETLAVPVRKLPPWLLTPLPIRAAGKDSDILGRPDCPAIVSLTLVVPISKLGGILKLPEKKRGTPPLEITVRQTSGSCAYDNHFSLIHACFGRVLLAETKAADVCIIHEEDKGWQDSENVIFTTRVPSWGLLCGPRATINVSLQLSTRPSTAALQSRFGLIGELYRASLDNARQVFVYASPPRLQDVSDAARYHLDGTAQASSRKLSPQRSSSMITIELGKASPQGRERIGALSYRLQLTSDDVAMRHLQAQAVASVSYASPCTLRIKMATFEQQLSFPYPIDASSARLRMARKSGYIDVVVPLALSAVAKHGYQHLRFPLVRASDPRQLGPWSASHVNFAQLTPVVNDSGHWLEAYMREMLSASERQVMDRSYKEPSTPIHSVKQSIHILFEAIRGRHPHCPGIAVRYFSFLREETPRWVLFVAGLFHDCDAQSVVLQCYLLGQDAKPPSSLDKGESPIVSINIDEHEEALWRQLLPLTAERCRDYPHKDSCYLLRPSINRESEESPLCACGVGKSRYKCGDLATARQGICIAISPIYPLALVEPVISSEMRTTMDEAIKGLSLREGQIVGTRNRTEMGCEKCGKVRGEGVKLLKCARCQMVSYCGRECQKADWKRHKSGCS